MGVPRLSQDLLPYTNRVKLGTPVRDAENGDQPPTIQSLIIDGPSLVYFVYNKLQSSRTQDKLTPFRLPPTYSEINKGVRYLLDDFQTHGVILKHIFFDGGLPESKHETRMERMEKLRHQLDVFRRMYPNFPPLVADTVEVQDFDAILYGTSAMSSRDTTLPPPPFMVASVIEALTAADWKNIVRVVPGEADEYCAQAARESSEVTAILSTDSDLALHDLGRFGRMCFLHSLEKRPQNDLTKHARTPHTVLALDPEHAVAKMDVPSLLAFGFQRSLEPSASLAVLRARTKDYARQERQQEDFSDFANQYTPCQHDSLGVQFSLRGLDPRTSEIVVSATKSPSVCLTPILEDPQRDSSWSYGASIRELGYSLLKATFPMKGLRDVWSVTEHARKGPRIASTAVGPLQRSTMIERAVEIRDNIVNCLSAIAAAPDPTASGRLSVILQWYFLALTVIRKEKVQLGKPTPSLSDLVRLFGMPQSSQTSHKPFRDPRATWDDVHLLANIHAVLYSLRMLGQIATHVATSPDRTSAACLDADKRHSDEQLSSIVEESSRALDNMPPLAELFLDISQLRQEMTEVDNESRNSMINQMTRVLEDGKIAARRPSQKGARSVDPEEAEFMSPDVKKRKRKKTQQNGLITTPAQKANPFDVLSNHRG